MDVLSFGPKRIMGMNYSRYVALPKAWLQSRGLTKGDEVTLELTESGDLLIRAVKKDKGEK